MRRYLFAVLVMITLAAGVAVFFPDRAEAVTSAVLGRPIVTESLQRDKPKCGKDCQRSNDVYFKNDGFTDYFINDSDGGKDAVFTIYHKVPMPTVGEGVQCDLVTKFEAEGVAMFAVCPGPEVVAIGSASQSNNDEDNG